MAQDWHTQGVARAPVSVSSLVAKPTGAFKPRSFSVVGPRRTTTTTRPKGPRFGPDQVGADGEPIRDDSGRPVRKFLGWKQEDKTRACWDLRIHRDGHRWFDRHYSAGRAAAAKETLLAGFAQGLPFDPTTKRLLEASLLVTEVDATLWQSYIDRWKFNTRSGRPHAQSSLTRHLADVRQMWSWISATNHLPDPWPLLNTRTRSSAGGRRSSTVRPVDRTIVLAPNHVRELANICGDGSFGPLAEV